jgi:hypothetical protein
MKKLVFALITSAGLLSAGTFTGIITDSMCLKDHTAMGITPDAKCIRECRKGSGITYVLFDGKKAYKLSNQQLPEQFASQQVKVTGTLYEKTGIIKVDKIEQQR